MINFHSQNLKTPLISNLLWLLISCPSQSTDSPQPTYITCPLQTIRYLISISETNSLCNSLVVSYLPVICIGIGDQYLLRWKNIEIDIFFKAFQNLPFVTTHTGRQPAKCVSFNKNHVSLVNNTTINKGAFAFRKMKTILSTIPHYSVLELECPTNMLTKPFQVG